MDMVGHASLGMTWAGQRTVKAVIVWIASEAVDDIERRIRAWRLRHKITGPMPFYIRSVPVYINKAEAAEQLRQEIEAIKSRHRAACLSRHRHCGHELSARDERELDRGHGRFC
jgi:hypothetical protein